MIPVMLIEDEFLVRMGLKTCISWEDEGYEIVAEAQDGESAIELYEKEKPKLIISDISLPKMSGIEAMKIIREKDPDVKFIILTAYDNFDLAREAIRIGVEEYFVKGNMDPKEITEVLRNLKIKYQNEFQGISDKIKAPLSLKEIYHMSQISKEPREYLKLEILEEELRFLVFHIRDTDLERFSELLHSFFAQRNVSHQYGKMKNYIWFFVSQGEKELLELLDEVKIMLGRYIHSNVQVGISQNFYVARDMKGTIYEALLAANFLKGKSGVCRELYTPGEENYREMKLLARKLNEVLKLKQFDEAPAILEQIFALIQQEYSVNSFRKILYKLGALLVDYDIEYRENLYYTELLSELDMDRIPERMLSYIQEIKENASSAGEDNLYIRKAKEYVYQNYDQQLSISKVADYVHVSPNYLGKLFTNETGEYLTDFINQVKMEKARDLLLERTYSINEIAAQVGVVDQRYFSKLFKKYYQMSPKEYQKLEEH